MRARLPAVRSKPTRWTAHRSIASPLVIRPRGTAYAWGRRAIWATRLGTRRMAGRIVFRPTSSSLAAVRTSNHSVVSDRSHRSSVTLHQSIVSANGNEYQPAQNRRKKTPNRGERVTLDQSKNSRVDVLTFSTEWCQCETTSPGRAMCTQIRFSSTRNADSNGVRSRVASSGWWSSPLSA
jgi:hypothetical protein